MDEQQTITIDDTEFNIDELSEVARAQISNIHATDQEIERLQRQITIMQTARQAYANVLAGELPTQSPEE